MHLEGQLAAWAAVPPAFGAHRKVCGQDFWSCAHASQNASGGWEEVKTHRQAAHEALLKGPLEGSRVSAPIQQLCSSIVEVGGVL